MHLDRWVGVPQADPLAVIGRRRCVRDRGHELYAVRPLVRFERSSASGGR